MRNVWVDLDYDVKVIHVGLAYRKYLSCALTQYRWILWGERTGAMAGPKGRLP